eukprot:GFUD01079853.1.p1 GENE.GFUD01079853.1~~GFUD01079853.1.p1  ORF type:complete len:706 (+),score=173.53 GFUD01079853.1:284-2119(+)
MESRNKAKLGIQMLDLESINPSKSGKENKSFTISSIQEQNCDEASDDNEDNSEEAPSCDEIEKSCFLSIKATKIETKSFSEVKPILEMEENENTQSILIVNPISVAMTAPIVYAPLNKVDINGEKRWTCDHCVKTYKHRRDLVEHINDHFHAYICPVCDKICNSKRYLKDHTSKYHKSNNDHGSVNVDSNLMLESKIDIHDTKILDNDSEAVVDHNIRQESEETNINCDISGNTDGVSQTHNECDVGVEIDISDTEMEKPATELKGVNNHLQEYHCKYSKDPTILTKMLPCNVKMRNIKLDMERNKEHKRQNNEMWKVSKKFVASSTSGKLTLAESKVKHKTEYKKGPKINNSKTNTNSEKISVNIKVINDLMVDNIVDVGSNDGERGKIILKSCRNCQKQFKTQRALISHFAKVHKNCENQIPHGQVKNEEISVEEVHRSEDNKQYMDRKEKNTNEEIKTTNYVKNDEPIVSQIAYVSKQLKHIFISEELDLSEDFSSLLTAPQFQDLIKTFFQFHQVPVDSLDYMQKQFADLLISELVTADIVDVKSLEEILVKIYRKDTSADLQAWKKSINNEIESISLASEVDRNFHLDIAIQIMILHCLPAILGSG